MDRHIERALLLLLHEIYVYNVRDEIKLNKFARFKALSGKLMYAVRNKSVHLKLFFSRHITRINFSNTVSFFFPSIYEEREFNKVNIWSRDCDKVEWVPL